LFSKHVFIFMFQKSSMYRLLGHTIILTLFTLQWSFGQQTISHKFNFRKLLESGISNPLSFCVPAKGTNIDACKSEGINVKYSTKKWHYIQASPVQIENLLESGAIQNYYLEFSIPKSLGDSSTFMHSVQHVQAGFGGLSSPYTGKGIIVGIVDEGLDWTHPDFKDSLGRTRVLRYWDHSTSGANTPQPYGYGTVWDSSSINNLSCLSTENTTAHGTTVTGKAVGNALANGSNIGMAPDANIVVVETNFNLPNWTLTIADACDYIFKVADSLNMPAVINLSLGTYLGSHDGNDPASEYIEQLLDEKNGRIVVCAAGNSGMKGKYHVHGEVDSDTSFVWFMNNPSANAALGPNHIYFDLWTDSIDANFRYGYGADLPGPYYGLRGTSIFHPATGSLNTPVFDTIYNSFGQRIATIETYTEIVNGSFHLEGYFNHIDSLNYLFRFMTTDSGSYDLWSGAWLGINDIVSNIPSSQVEPDIIHYHAPDSLQSIVSSWNCSDKVISVGNIRNRSQFINKNGVPFIPPVFSNVGQLHPTSSKGPSRQNIIKPDVSAAGEVSLGAAPLWLLTNPIYNNLIDSGGWHVINGGTSMASPVVAGIAALFLEKCDKAGYQDFKNALLSSTFSDTFTGSVPNNGYGYGKPNALDLMLGSEYSVEIVGTDSICQEGNLSLSGNNLATANWSNGQNTLQQTVTEGGEYSAVVYNLVGCKSYTDTFQVSEIEPLPMLPIFQTGNTLATLSLTNYQWTLNGVDIPGATEATIDISPPYGTYTCYCTDVNGCVSETNPYTPFFASQDEIVSLQMPIFPNPANDEIFLPIQEDIYAINIFDAAGKIVLHTEFPDLTLNIRSLSPGVYTLCMDTSKRRIVSKIIKL
jgi:subtilisin family serine protease